MMMILKKKKFISPRFYVLKKFGFHMEYASFYQKRSKCYDV